MAPSRSNGSHSGSTVTICVQLVNSFHIFIIWTAELAFSVIKQRMIQDAAERMRTTLTMRDITVHNENFLDDRKFFSLGGTKIFYTRTTTKFEIFVSRPETFDLKFNYLKLIALILAGFSADFHYFYFNFKRIIIFTRTSPCSGANFVTPFRRLLKRNLNGGLGRQF